MKKLVLSTTLLASLAFMGSPANATIVDDPLQGVCFTGGGCTDNGSSTPFNIAQQTGGWGFRADPGGLSGELELVFGVPSQLGSIAIPTITGSTTQAGQVTGTWNSGDLQTFLGISGKPDNPIDAFTSVSISGTTGFTIYTADGGHYTNICNCATPVDQFSLAAALPNGSFIVGILALDNAGGNVFTAPSGQLSAVPGPAVGAGLPGLIAALGGMVGLHRFRRKRRVA
jgi:hypothetical protein